jgi:Fe-S-cluster containining protein
VTGGDVKRITRQTGTIGFIEYARPGNPDYADQSDDPVWQSHVFRPDGTRRILKKRDNGDCFFLGLKGCTLTLETRPLICRLYPFAYNARGLYADLVATCPTHLLATGETLLNCLDMSLDMARVWHHDLYDEILHDDDDYWPDLRLAV